MEINGVAHILVDKSFDEATDTSSKVALSIQKQVCEKLEEQKKFPPLLFVSIEQRVIDKFKKENR